MCGTSSNTCVAPTSCISTLGDNGPDTQPISTVQSLNSRNGFTVRMDLTSLASGTSFIPAAPPGFGFNIYSMNVGGVVKDWYQPNLLGLCTSAASCDTLCKTNFGDSGAVLSPSALKLYDMGNNPINACTLLQNAPPATEIAWVPGSSYVAGGLTYSGGSANGAFCVISITLPISYMNSKATQNFFMGVKAPGWGAPPNIATNIEVYSNAAGPGGPRMSGLNVR